HLPRTRTAAAHRRTGGHRLAGADGAEQQGLHRRDLGRPGRPAARGHPGGHRDRGRGRGAGVPRPPGRPDPPGGRDGRGDHRAGDAVPRGAGAGVTSPGDTAGPVDEHGVATWHVPDWTVDELVDAKAGWTVSVVLPALNEQDTVAGVVATITPLLGGLVDELVVLDSGSTDDTAARARAAGATVISREEAIPGLAPRPGKGEALWRGVAATTGDVVVFIDSDLIEPDPSYVPNLVGPLLTRPGVHHVKGFYRRPLRITGTEDPVGGGRVTELVA